MLSYIGKRILSLIPVLFVVSFVVFLVVYMIPGGPATAILGLEASADQINALNAQLGFDRPFLVQYGDWIVNVFQGNWGDSFFLHESVTEAIAEYFGPTISLAILAQLIALVLSVPLGILAAYKRGSATDVAAVSVSLLGIAIPGFLLSMFLMLFFSHTYFSITLSVIRLYIDKIIIGTLHTIFRIQNCLDKISSTRFYWNKPHSELLFHVFHSPVIQKYPFSGTKHVTWNNEIFS